MKKISVIVFLLSVLVFVQAYSQNKTALLIANGGYKNFTRLKNPIPEAGKLKAALQRIGFTVTLITDASKEKMLDALYDFEKTLDKKGGIAFFHYGGHAVQVDGKNHLIPVNADIPDERRVSTRALDSDEIMATLDASGSDSNIIILDSCRNNPLPAESRSATRGLAVSGKKPKNSIIVYSAESGTVALDGVFTPALLKYIETPGASFTDIIRKTRAEVYKVSKGAQIPGAYDQLFDNIYLVVKVGSGIADTEKEISREKSVIDLPKDFVYVKGGTFMMGSNEDHPLGLNSSHPSHRVTVNDFAISRFEVTQELYKKVTGNNPSQNFFPGITKYNIGDKKPVNNISWYDAVEFCNKLSLLQGRTPAYIIDKTTKDPTNKNDNDELKWKVTWNKNSNGYRLPTEAEWEYAARGGAKSKNFIYSGSNEPGEVAWIYKNSGEKISSEEYSMTAITNNKCSTHPVGQKQANELGIYDMTGNISEFCWDWIGRYKYNSIQINPEGPSSGKWRVIRGGPAAGPEWEVFSRNFGSASSDKGVSAGFRLVLNVE